MYLIDHYIDALNYKSPSIKFFVTIENNIKEGIYPINNLNFNPSFIKTDKGLVLNEIIENSTYSYERNDVFSYDDATNKIYYFTAFGLEIELIIMKEHIKECKMLFQILEDFINLLFFQQFL